jgi:tetratricopeptide (TPR) repeat protein
MGYVQYKQKDYPAALKAYQEVDAICQALLEEIKTARKPVWILNQFAKTAYNMATIYLAENRATDARQSFEKSLQYRIALVETHPSVTEFHETLGGVYREISNHLHNADQDQQAFEYIHKSLEIFQRLVGAHRAEARYHSELGRTWNLLAVFRHHLRENVPAIHVFNEAVEEQRNAIAISDDVDDYKAYLSNHLENLGAQHVVLGGYDEGMECFREALEGRSKLYDAHPNTRKYAIELANTLQTVAGNQLYVGEFDSANGSFAKARLLLDRLAADAPEDVEISRQLGDVLTKEAVTLAEQQKLAEAQTLLERAVQVLTPIGTPETAAPMDRGRLSEALWQLARVHRARKEPKLAGQRELERKALWNARLAKELAELVQKEIARSAMIVHGKTVDSSRAKAIRDRDFDLAADDLGLAISNGFTDLGMLESIPEFAMLLEHDGVKSMVERLKSPKRPQEPGPKNLKER